MELQNEQPTTQLNSTDPQPFNFLAYIDQIQKTHQELDSLWYLLASFHDSSLSPENLLPALSDMADIGRRLNQQAHDELNQLYNAWKTSRAASVKH